MTIDERLERLAERHQALSESVESLALSVKELHDSVRVLENTAKLDGENIRGLARIAEIHERRLTDLASPQ
jgi:hypothetical protein